MGTYGNIDEDDEEPKRSTAWYVRTIVGFLLMAGAITGAAYGLYRVAHPSDKHSDGGAPHTPSTPTPYTPGDDPSEDGPGPDFGPPGFAPTPIVSNNYSFGNALELSLTFLNIQKSGKLPADNPITWRGDSALDDGSDAGIDLSGGLYDAGDHIKFGLPMAFTATVLSWSVLEYAPQMTAADQLNKAVDIIKWVTDYLIKAHPDNETFYMQVGDPGTDHDCWQRPEDISITRPSYKLDPDNAGSDVMGEAAAAMAAASLVFRQPGTAYENTTYADLLLSHAAGLFDFADQYPGSYTESYPTMQMYYNSTGFEDELLWAATWLYYATGDQYYLDYTTGSQGENFGGWGKAPLWFSWDDKRAGVHVLLARKHLLQPVANTLQASKLLNYKTTADKLMCSLLPNSPTASARRTKGGMIWVSQWSASVHTVNAALLAVIYSDYLTAAKLSLSCSGNIYKPDQLRWFAYSQIDYLLGSNPMKMSYLVGYGDEYPKFLHHRGASIPSDGVPYDCKGGFQWLHSTAENPHVASGALVGGPFFNESYSDSRDNIQQNEASIYNSATLAGVVAGLSFTAQQGVPKTYLS
ncbi:hypothetical protein R1flu_012808 [Riccia fluitans]|uniref:Endoglucanase n=1 Tax=Riccia fluitans TaxID=41844 RepID=A0ABD1ZBU1_9MARC